MSPYIARGDRGIFFYFQIDRKNKPSLCDAETNTTAGRLIPYRLVGTYTLGIYGPQKSVFPLFFAAVGPAAQAVLRRGFLGRSGDPGPPS